MLDPDGEGREKDGCRGRGGINVGGWITVLSATETRADKGPVGQLGLIFVNCASWQDLCHALEACIGLSESLVHR